ncbi:hypothetical protein GCM10007301_36660 [Azorhizobium oxalatiphilum]|uniref:Branched-chain amino acid ABC transporter permease n=1 Tax=Azorhizobium oxalatiphilum TaxID=980631 RepID=A0A917C5S7_9HYPH|nr:branched-chain amino acid ABC transporter permease [Azorhizobium oxalatiphilum]GGF73502.1 hypothetical protein GCM10007301_36660 [Azorhizobium oxalatiphilum]
MTGRRIGLLLAALLCLAGCGRVVDADQADICARAAPALHPDGTAIVRSAAAPARGKAIGVRLSYQAREPGRAHPFTASITCRFAAANGPERLELTGLRTADGELSPVRLMILKRWWLDTEASPLSVPSAPFFLLGPEAAYGLQQGLNALAPMALYAALATAFTLLHGLTGRIVLAIGEVAVTGGAAMLVMTGAAELFGPLALWHLVIGVLAAMATSAAWALLIGHFMLRRFRDRQNGGQGVLIASIGLALALREALTLQRSVTAGWLPPLLHASIPLAGSPAFAATITPAALVAITATGGAVGFVVMAMRASAFGRNWRAMADDPRMAALCGIAPERLISQTCLISGALAGLSGAMLVLVFGSVDAAFGLPLTLKSLAAAILGGVGSVMGAALGGLAIGLLEGLWSSAFDIAYRDVVMYALLGLALLLRPNGLTGPRRREV